jgi:hypothetical protein
MATVLDTKVFGVYFGSFSPVLVQTRNGNKKVERSWFLCRDDQGNKFSGKNGQGNVTTEGIMIFMYQA